MHQSGVFAFAFLFERQFLEKAHLLANRPLLSFLLEPLYLKRKLATKENKSCLEKALCAAADVSNKMQDKGRSYLTNLKKRQGRAKLKGEALSIEFEAFKATLT